MTWTKPRILQKLRQLHRAGRPMSYSQMTMHNQRLISAAAYHFGSYRNAIEQARIDYRELIQRPRWTRQRIIALIKHARRRGQDLNWAAVTGGGGELAKAAFAAIQSRLFGSWPRALHAAGLDADDVACYRAWDRNTILYELRARAQEADPLGSGAVQQDDPSLHAAAVRYFGNYRKALRAADLDGNLKKRRRDGETKR